MARLQGQGPETGAHAASVRDFIAGYMQGQPWEHISGEDALTYYDALSPQLDPADLERAAEAAFRRMGPEMLHQLAHFMRKRAHEQQFDFPELSGANERYFGDPIQMSRIVSNLELKQPGILREMLVGGGVFGGKGSLVAERHAYVHDPLFKATIGGIAACAMALRMGVSTEAGPGLQPG